MTARADKRQRELANASSRTILKVPVEPTEDMKAERARASFRSEELAEELNSELLNTRSPVDCQHLVLRHALVQSDHRRSRRGRVRCCQFRQPVLQKQACQST